MKSLKTASPADVSSEAGRIEEIKKLHTRIGSYLRNTLADAMKIGKLLDEQKAKTRHGEWLPWIKANLPFSERVAQDYIRFWDRREEIKAARIADLAGARKLLAAPKPKRSGRTTSSAPRSKKATASKAAPNEVHRLATVFADLYESDTGEKPYIGGRQYGIIKNLLKQQTPEDIELRLHLYFSGDFWFTKDGYGLGGFVAHYNEIAEPKKDRTSSGGGIRSDSDFAAAYGTLFRLLQRDDASLGDVVALREAMWDYKRAQGRKGNWSWKPPIARNSDGCPVELGNLKNCELYFEEGYLSIASSRDWWLEEAFSVNQTSYDVIAELRRGGEWAERLFDWVCEQDAFAGTLKDLWGREESPGVVKTLIENRIVTNDQVEAFTIETFLVAWDDLQDRWGEESEAWEAERARNHSEAHLAVRDWLKNGPTQLGEVQRLHASGIDDDAEYAGRLQEVVELWSRVSHNEEFIRLVEGANALQLHLPEKISYRRGDVVVFDGNNEYTQHSLLALYQLLHAAEVAARKDVA